MTDSISCAHPSIDLIEHSSAYLEDGWITPEIEVQIHRHYRELIRLEAPCYGNQHQWKISALGQIGMIPLALDRTLRIHPKTPIQHIWQAIDYIEDFTSLKIFDAKIAECDRLEDGLDRLVRKLTTGILKRIQMGLASQYMPRRDRLAAVRGRIDWTQAAQTPWEPHLPCRYTEHTPDIPDNQILLWTVTQLGRTGPWLSEQSRQNLRKIRQALTGTIRLQSFRADDCRDRPYNRLNQDYQPLHILCGFLLDCLSLNQQQGHHHALPFLISTAQLYEKFVATWLHRNLPDPYILKAQERYQLTKHHHYQIDMVIYDRQSGQAIAVIDTKYKVPDKASHTDINQVIAYAQFKNAQHAILIYTEPLKYPLNTPIDSITQSPVHLQTLAFPLVHDPSSHAKILQLFESVE